MIITNDIKMDLGNIFGTPQVKAVQNDKNTRALAISLYANGQAWTPPDDTIAVVRYRKPDGRGGEYDLLPDGSPAWGITKNVVTVALAPQVLTTAGPVRLNVGLINGEKEISTFRIQLNVEPNVYAELVDSEDYYSTSWINTEIAQLRADVADLQYDVIGPIDITSIANSIGIVELGTSVPMVTITWAVNREPASQTAEGEAVDAAARSAELTGPFASTRTFEVTATDERGATDKATTTINFYNGVYYGVLEDGATLDPAAVLSLTRKLQNSRALTFTANAGASQRIAYALPTRFKTPGFNVGGFDGGFYRATTIMAFENKSGYTEPYDVWLSDNVGLGSTTVKVT